MQQVVVVAGGCVAFAAFVVLAYRRRWQWTGLPAVSAAGTGAEDRPAKTLWDWLQLLGIPVALAALAFLLNDAQGSRGQRHEDQRAAQQLAIAADAERESTLRTYLAQMSDLMLDRRLLRSKPGADVRNVARTATLTAVRRLDGPRRSLVVRFLAEARLLRRSKSANATVLVASADLSHANLGGVNLRWANLAGADLRHGDLVGADLGHAGLRRTDFRQADVAGADLVGADLVGADFNEADVRHADLVGADLRRADVRWADLRWANLVGANLRGANLRHADLRGADLREADLRGAGLRGSNLNDANLRGARGVSTSGARGTVSVGP